MIHAAAVAASERYNTRFEDAMRRRLGVRFADRADSIRENKRVIREIVGIPDALVKHFSQRRAAIEERYRGLAADDRKTHGHEPPTAAQLKLAQQATLETREAKEAPKSLADKLTAWRGDAGKVIGRRGVERLGLDTLGTATPPTDVSALALDALARSVVSTVSAEKTTWTRWNLLAEAERQLRPLHFDSAAARQAATDLVLEHALRPDVAVRLTTDGLEPDVDQDVPDLSTARRSDGESVLHEHGSTRYTTQDLLDAEQRLLTYAAQPTTHALSPTGVLELITAFEQRHGVTLDPGQRALVTGFTTNPRRLVVGIGPAGAGKTTALRAVAESWRTTGRRVVPLAPSATAAEVLGSEMGCRAENLHKLRHP